MPKKAEEIPLDQNIGQHEKHNETEIFEADRSNKNRDDLGNKYYESLKKLDRLREIQNENENLKKQVKEFEERFLSSDERERKRWLEFQSKLKNEKEDLMNRASEWEKKYRRTFLENSLLSSVNQFTSRHGYRVKDIAALKSLLFSEDFAPAKCRLRQAPNLGNQSESELEVVIDVQEQDQTGQIAYRSYDLKQGLEKALHLCPWLFESVSRGGAGMQAGINIPGNLGSKIEALKNKVKGNPADRLSRIQLTKLLALRQKNLEGGF
jgi:hypothetical protein